jgi:hypothetical protein
MATTETETDEEYFAGFLVESTPPPPPERRRLYWSIDDAIARALALAMECAERIGTPVRITPTYESVAAVRRAAALQPSVQLFALESYEGAPVGTVSLAAAWGRPYL